MGFFSRLGQMVSDNVGKAFDAAHHAENSAEASLRANAGKAFDAAHHAENTAEARLDTAIADRLSKGAQSFRESATIIAHGGETVHAVSKPASTPHAGKLPHLREI